MVLIFLTATRLSDHRLAFRMGSMGNEIFRAVVLGALLFVGLMIAFIAISLGACTLKGTCGL